MPSLGLVQVAMQANMKKITKFNVADENVFASSANLNSPILSVN